jgi:uncharacterized protein
MTTRSDVESFLQCPALALVGLSRSGKKFGNLACRELRTRGYRVYPIHKSAESIDGVTCVRDFASLPEPVDAVLVVVPPAEAMSVVRDAAAHGLHHVWLQQGAESPDVLQACQDLRLNVVSGECILMFASPRSYHKLHRAVWRWLGKLPH